MTNSERLYYEQQIKQLSGKNFNLNKFPDNQIYAMYIKYKNKPIVDKSSKSIKSKSMINNTAKNTCEFCGTQLNDAGECPICDLGDEDYYELLNFKNNIPNEIKAAIKYFTVTNEPYYGPTFIMRDGLLLNLQKYAHHTNVENYLIDKGLSNEIKSTMLGSPTLYKEGCIRCDTDKYYIALTEKQPTREQYQSLLEWLDFLFTTTNIVEIITPDNQQIVYNKNNIIPDEIVDRIRRYYSSGKLYETKIIKLKHLHDFLYPRTGIGTKLGEENINEKFIESDIKMNNKWELVKVKQVYDSDGFLTDYTWYTDGSKHIFMFGDIDFTEPDENYADFGTDDTTIAGEWFDSYNGFEDEDDINVTDIFDEAYDEFEDLDAFDDELNEDFNQVYEIEYTDRDSGEELLKDKIKGKNQADAIDKYFKNPKNASNEITKITAKKDKKLNEVAPIVAAAAGAAISSFANRLGNNLADKLTEEETKAFDIKKFVKNIKYNGPSYRGASMPRSIENAINAANIPDNMRIKYMETEVVGDNDIQMTYISQESFSDKDLNVFIKEVKRALTALAKQFSYKKPISVALDIKSRNDENIVYIDFNVNEDLKESINDLMYEIGAIVILNGKDRERARITDILDDNYYEVKTIDSKEVYNVGNDEILYAIDNDEELIEEVEEYLVNGIKKVDKDEKSLCTIDEKDVIIEDVEETPLAPALPGKDSGIANILIALIQSEWTAIDDYNNAIASLAAYNEDEMINVLEDIIAEENVHVGQLLKVLDTIAPNTKGIDEGTKEAEQQLNEPSEIVQQIQDGN